MNDVVRRLRLARDAATLEPRLVWVMGSARSGPTWLASLLANLTGSTLVDEPLVGAHLAVPMGAVTSLPRTDDPLVADANADRPAYVFARSAAWAWQPALRRLLLHRLAADAPRRGTVVVKEPNGALAAPMLMEVLPKARLLFLLRDGRDVVDSMLDGASGGWIAQTHGASVAADTRRDFLEQRARQWVRTVEAVERAHDAHDPTRRLRLTYEELRADTATHVERVVRWLGRDDVLPRVADAVERFSFERLPAETKGSGRFARAATPGLWRDNLPADEQAVLHEVMGPTLARLGYPT